jgi:hypothetical protein
MGGDQLERVVENYLGLFVGECGISDVVDL